jgi:hypothetical protein
MGTRASIRGMVYSMIEDFPGFHYTEWMGGKSRFFGFRGIIGP